jgi:hypothetical protein
VQEGNAQRRVVERERVSMTSSIIRVLGLMRVPRGGGCTKPDRRRTPVGLGTAHHRGMASITARYAPPPRSRDRLRTTRAFALFTSLIPTGSRPTRAEVDRAIVAAIRTWGGSAGCVAEVAYAYGERPETSAPRMRWARTIVTELYARRSLPVVRALRLTAYPAEASASWARLRPWAGPTAKDTERTPTPTVPALV